MMNDREHGNYGTSEINRNGLTILVGAKAPTEPEQVPSASDEAKARTDALWAGAEKRYGVGSKHTVKVVNFKPYGVFVETSDGLFGLIHNSLILHWDWSRHFDEVFHIGQELEVTVTRVDLANRRLAFSYDCPQTEPTARQAATKAEASADYTSIAEKWIEEHPENSESARAWLNGELESGPIYGPLTNALADRYGVPIPVSYWIRRFDEFACSSGKADNPVRLPAVSLRSRADDAAYWKLFKTTASQLSDAKRDEERQLQKIGALVSKIRNLDTFPNSPWFKDYVYTSTLLSKAGDRFGVEDTRERLVVPMFAQMGWPVGNGAVNPVSLVRGSQDSFAIRLYSGDAHEERLAVAVAVDVAGTSFFSQKNQSGAVGSISKRNVVERVLAWTNCQRDLVEGVTRIVWTNGLEWVVFSSEILKRRIGILSDRSGERILEEAQKEDAERWFRRVVFTSAGSYIDSLGLFIRLQEQLGRENF